MLVALKWEWPHSVVLNKLDHAPMEGWLPRLAKELLKLKLRAYRSDQLTPWTWRTVLLRLWLLLKEALSMAMVEWLRPSFKVLRRERYLLLDPWVRCRRDDRGR